MTALDFDLALFYRFAVALGIGGLVGMERERRRRKGAEMFAGVRTFAILSLVGCTAAMISSLTASPLPLLAILLGISALLVAAYNAQSRRNEHETGLTTEAAALLTVLTGALCYYQYVTMAAALGVSMLLLLSLKAPLHRFAERINTEDVYATIKFAVVSLIVLPILPDRSFGPPPFDVLNPYNIWWMVVLISGISFAGYVLMKMVDAGRGIGLTGLLGGLVSSTAVTLTFTQRSKEQPPLSNAFAIAILGAWTVMFLRVLVEVFAVNRGLLVQLWLPMSAGALVGLVYGALLYRRQALALTNEIEIANPFELGPAIKFGAIYAAILLIARTAEMYFGNTGVYISSVLSGTADLHAITLSMAQLSLSDGLDPLVAARAVSLATLSNTLVKAGMVAVLGTPALKRVLLPVVPVIVAVTLAAAFLL